MASIPLGDFSQARAIPRAEPNRVDLSAVQAGRGAAAIGDALMQVGERGAHAEEQRIAREKAEAEAIAQAKASNALDEYRLQTGSVSDDVGDQMRRGADYNKADELYTTSVEKIKPPAVEGLSPEAQERFTGAIGVARESARLRVKGFATAARRDDGQRQFAIAIDNAGKFAVQPGANIETINATLREKAGEFVKLFGIDGSAADKAVQDRIDANWYNHAVSQATTARDDVNGLRALQKELTDEKGYYVADNKLDPANRAQLTSSIASRIDVLEGKAERDKNKADTLSARLRNEYEEQLASGVPPTLDQQKAWAEAFKAAGDDEKVEWQALYKTEQEVRGLFKLPIDQQLRAVRERRATMMQAGGDKRDRANLSRLEKAVQSNVTMLTDQPLKYAVTRGGEEVPPLDFQAVVDPSKGGVIGAQLKQRAVVVDGFRAQFGPQVKARLLFPEEAAGLVALLDRSSAEDKAVLFGQLQRETGSSRIYNAVMAQIQPDAPVTAFAGRLAAQGPAATRIATAMLEGEALLNRSKGDAATDGKFKGMKLPEQSAFDEAMNEAVGAAFRGKPEAFNVAMQAVRAAYAGYTVRAGDVSGEINEARMAGVIQGVLGETVDFNGRGDVFVPYGMDPDDFEDKAASAWTELSPQVADGFSNDLSDYGLEQITDGLYYLTAGRGYVPGKNGKPLVLDLSAGHL